ncbi:hypothetical protein Goarm_007281 [Gossypium armourianum]|uniref:Uncharacterized protein n=1 Tax=Gossypium armourianum TaxID=34283 RepID=A0A7J9JLB6_9ROSI|nr:hypothetical protein [Gossypium armourianum]
MFREVDRSLMDVEYFIRKTGKAGILSYFPSYHCTIVSVQNCS